MDSSKDKVKYGSLPLHECSGKTFFIGDIHSEGIKLQSLLEKVKKQLLPEDRVVFLGDLFDRGAYSALTVETLVSLVKTYSGQIFFVEGNHDWMLRTYLTHGDLSYMHYILSTLQDFKSSWNLTDIRPDTIMTALIDKEFHLITKSMLPYYETEEVIATHAPLDQQEVYMIAGDRCEYYKALYKNKTENFKYLLESLEDNIMWQFTEENLSVNGIDKYLICGHQTPASLASKPRIRADRAFIDSGCGKGDRPCTAFIYPTKDFIQSD